MYISSIALWHIVCCSAGGDNFRHRLRKEITQGEQRRVRRQPLPMPPLAATTYSVW